MDESTLKKLIDAPPAALKEACKAAMVSYCRAFKSSKTFQFEGREYKYFYHPYNLAWRNERAVEIPIARAFLESHQGEDVLEVGNVLSHYEPIDHAVLDRYEIAPGVVNEDAAAFQTPDRYGLIISISTLEHVGMDEQPRDSSRPLAAVRNLIGLLAPGGELVATAPLGLNPDFDMLLEQDGPFTWLGAMVRDGRKNEWHQVGLESVLGSSYDTSAFRARAVVIGRITKGGPGE
ncbi:MAG: class I SAM-dependent methyltransferase [Candidatus Geothermincolia bacterium]